MNGPNTTSIRQTDADGNETLVEVGPFGINATIQHPAVVAFSTAMYEWFRTSGGQNYVEVRCQVEDPEKGMQQFCITMQRVGGLTPTEKLATAESRVRELEAQLAAAREDSARLDWWESSGGASRAIIDELMQDSGWSKPHRIIGGACIDCGKPLAEKCIPFDAARGAK